MINKYLCFLVTISPFLYSGCDFVPEVRQPVAYSHALHLTEAGMDCVECHIGVETQLKATLPSIKRCKSCHTKSKTGSPDEALVVEAVISGTEIPWNRIYELPDHVFFSHRRHVKSGKVSCTVCHGEMEKLTEPATGPLKPFTMDTCMSCHDNKSISNDCLTCHV